VRKDPSYIVVGFFVLSGLFKLVPVLFPDVLPLDSDEAVVGLMARHLVQGEFPRFFYGQTYGGGLEVLLAGALQLVLPSGLAALRLAAALLALATECLFYRALASAIPIRTPRLAATAMLALGGMTYARFVAHLYGTHLNNAFIFALLLACLSDLRKLPRRALLIGLAVGIGYWVSPHVWVFFACILVIRLRQWRELPRISLLCLFLLTLGFALGALPRIIHSYSPESWYAPYQAGGFALLHGVAAIPSRAFELIARTLTSYFFGSLLPLGVVGVVALILGSCMSALLLVLAAWSCWKDWYRRREAAFVPAAILLFAGVSVALVVLNRKVFDSGYRYLWPVQFAMAAAWAKAIYGAVRQPSPTSGRLTELATPGRSAAGRTLGAWILSLPFLLGTLSLFLAQRADARSGDTAIKRAIAEQALEEGCRVGVADYWYAYSLSLLTEEKLKLAPIYTPRIRAYVLAAANAMATKTRYCAILDLSPQAQDTQTNHRYYEHLLPEAYRSYRYPGDVILLVLGERE
jgi:hypothetical protein